MGERWLTVTEVQARLKAAGYPDSLATIRRAVDAGKYGPQGDAWYKTEGGSYRMVSTEAVDALIARRRKSPEDRTPG